MNILKKMHTIFFVIVPYLFVGVIGIPHELFPSIEIDTASGLDGRIVGGNSVNIEDFPYQASIQLLSNHLCGGSIISQRYILSAAHCFRTRIYPTSFYTVRVGSSLYNSGGQVVKVNSITTHPNYNSRTINNDIAILELTSDLPLSASVAIISLADENYTISVGIKSVVSGWGILSFRGERPLHLQAVTVPIFQQSSCVANYAQIQLSVTGTMFCAGYANGGKDACQGDSGGPLVINGKQVGVVSWGEGCALPMLPGVYASVPYFRSYIKQVTGL